MALDTWQRTTPELTRSDYATYYTEPCVKEEEGGQTWCRGTGIAPHAHPLHGSINFGNCEACGSRDVLVIAAQRSVHMMSGDAYWDYEIVCRECKAITARAFAGND